MPYETPVVQRKISVPWPEGRAERPEVLAQNKLVICTYADRTVNTAMSRERVQPSRAVGRGPGRSDRMHEGDISGGSS